MSSLDKSKLEYYVFFRSWFDELKVERFNILEDMDLEIKELWKDKKITDREQLKEYLTNKFKKEYTTKVDFEYIISGLTQYDRKSKFDVYFQIEKNIDMITDYVIYKLHLDK